MRHLQKQGCKPNGLHVKWYFLEKRWNLNSKRKGAHSKLVAVGAVPNGNKFLSGTRENAHARRASGKVLFFFFLN